MRDLSFGFYGEGATEYDFLMPIVERTLQELLPQAYIYAQEILRPKNTEETQHQIDKIVRAAEQAHGLDILIVHLDADDRTPIDARQQRFEPGYIEVQRQEYGVNKDLIPVIPVRMTDAWTLVDFQAFCEVVGTRESAKDLGFPDHPKEVEAISDPKQKFTQAVALAAHRRKHRKRIDAGEVHGPLARQISLNLLGEVPAFRSFLDELTETLIKLRFLNDNS